MLIKHRFIAQKFFEKSFVSIDNMFG